MSAMQATRDEVETVAVAKPRPAASRPPVLEGGDRLTRAEFERRYWAMPEVNKAELIEGVVHMPSPVRLPQHGRPHASIMAWLGPYWAATPGTDLGDNTSARLDLDNEFQPDALLRLEPSAGGRSRISDDGFVEGAPELVVEVAASSAAVDLHDKFRVYRRNGVREYIVWRVQEEALDWFALGEGEPTKLAADAAGIVRSQVFPGLHLAVAALLKGDLATVLAELQKGLQTPEHAAFVQRLAEPGKGGS